MEGKIATLQTSPWGRIIDLQELGIQLPNKRHIAFLSYGGNCRDFQVGSKYPVKVFFHVSYISIHSKPGGSEDRQWAAFSTKTYKEAIAHPEFIRMQLPDSKIVPYFEILPT